MITQKRILTLTMLSLLFGSAHAGRHFKFYVGPHLNYMRLKFNNPNQLGGCTTGVTSGLVFMKKWFFANVDYEGYFNTGLMHGALCQTGKVQEQLLALRLGANWHPYNCFSLNGYLGVGFDRFLNRQDPSDECGETDGLLYKYTKLTIPLGFCADWHITDNSSVGLQPEWRPDVFARLHVLCENLNNECNNAFRIALPFKHTFKRNDHVRLYVAPFFDWNRFGKVCQTDCNGNLISIPALTRWDLGVRLVFCFQF
jgi:hypothetical protein